MTEMAHKGAPKVPSAGSTRDGHNGVELPVLVGVETLAERLGVEVRFVRRLVAERRVPFVKVGRYVRFDIAEVANWIDEQRVEAFVPGTERHRGR